MRSWLFAFLTEPIIVIGYEGEPVLDTGINAPDRDFLVAVGEKQPKWDATHEALRNLFALSRTRDITALLVVFPSHKKPCSALAVSPHSSGGGGLGCCGGHAERGYTAAHGKQGL
ncbi:MAG: hypothetical protein HRT77_02770 [Halioglobus sp.]|nr:hypothetical protein [Halioglobus sp.]